MCVYVCVLVCVSRLLCVCWCVHVLACVSLYVPVSVFMYLFVFSVLLILFQYVNSKRVFEDMNNKIGDYKTQSQKYKDSFLVTQEDIKRLINSIVTNCLILNLGVFIVFYLIRVWWFKCKYHLRLLNLQKYSFNYQILL